MLAVITGTINPSQEMTKLVVRNQKERLMQYVESLEFFLTSGAFNKIVFCENSNYEIEQLNFLQKQADLNHVKLEILSFQGDYEQAVIHGKGYGEGEIMRYVLENSKLIQGEDFLVKITGRLKVDNIVKIIKGINTQKTYFNIPNRTIRTFYDTRMYAMPIKQFRDFFLDSYKKVNDEKGIFLEHIYTNVLVKNKIRVCNFPYYPRIVGKSGSGGLIYGYTEWKCIIKDVLSRLNYYTTK